jgi:hypothetical protein
MKNWKKLEGQRITITPHTLVLILLYAQVLYEQDSLASTSGSQLCKIISAYGMTTPIAQTNSMAVKG